VDWNLRACGWRGHETYAPDEAELSARLHVDTPAGQAWRCLRCGTYVVGEPRGSGPAEHAPEVPRGRLLRDRVLMRALAVERGLRAVGLVALALLVLKFRGSHDTLQAAFRTDLPLLRPLATQLGWNPDDSRVVRGINDVFSLSTTTLTWIAMGLLVYAALQTTEAVGLWLVKRWGEYFAVIATSVFLPLEVYEIFERVTVLRLGALVVNLAAVVWLVWSKRLFGVRGGGEAYLAEHAAESLLTVDRAAARTAD
jgi:uncharacterized membrane protein (DUF2068 family)